QGCPDTFCQFDIPSRLDFQLDTLVTLIQPFLNNLDGGFHAGLNTNAHPDVRVTGAVMAVWQVTGEQIRQPHLVGSGESIPHRPLSACFGVIITPYRMD